MSQEEQLIQIFGNITGGCQISISKSHGVKIKVGWFKTTDKHYTLLSGLHEIAKNIYNHCYSIIQRFNSQEEQQIFAKLHDYKMKYGDFI